MTKNILLAATAMTAILAAGVANAQEAGAVDSFTAGATIFNGTDNTPIPVASETVSSNATRLLPASTLVISAEELLGGATYDFAVSLTGASYAAAVTGVPVVTQIGAAADWDADCYVVSAAAGTGGNGSTSVTYRVLVRDAISGNCDAAALLVVGDEIAITRTGLPIRATGIANASLRVLSAVGATNTNVNAANPGIDETIVLGSVVDGYEFDITPDSTPPLLALNPEPAFTTLTPDGDIGDVSFDRVTYDITEFAYTTARIGFTATEIPAVEADIELNITAADFDDLDPTGFDVDADDNTIATAADVSGVQAVVLAAAPGLTEAIANGTVRVSATLTPDFDGAGSASISLPDAFTGNLAPINLEATTFIAPWMTTGTNGFNTVLRISNNGTEDTGDVRAQVRSPSGVLLNDQPVVLGNVPAGGELVINSGTLAANFGDFGRGDVVITILSTDDDLTAKLRVVNPNGTVGEQSLGSASGANLSSITQ